MTGKHIIASGKYLLHTKYNPEEPLKEHSDLVNLCQKSSHKAKNKIIIQIFLMQIFCAIFARVCITIPFKTKVQVTILCKSFSWQHVACKWMSGTQIPFYPLNGKKKFPDDLQFLTRQIIVRKSSRSTWTFTLATQAHNSLFTSLLMYVNV